MIELYGDRTGNCLRVAVAFEEGGLAYQPHRVTLSRGEHLQPAFLALNPTGKVPVMVKSGDTGPLVIAQSMAIMLWAARRAPNALMPVEGTAAHAMAMERLMMVATDMLAASQTAFLLHMAGDRAGSQHINDVVVSRFDWLETALDGHAYLAGESFSLADIAAASLLAAMRGDERWAGRPRLAEWFSRIASREGFVRGMHAFD